MTDQSSRLALRQEHRFPQPVLHHGTVGLRTARVPVIQNQVQLVCLCRLD